MAYYSDNNPVAPVSDTTSRRQMPPFSRSDGNHRLSKPSSVPPPHSRPGTGHYRTSSLTTGIYRDGSSSSNSSSSYISNPRKQYGQPSLKRPRMDHSSISDYDDTQNTSSNADNSQNSFKSNHHNSNNNYPSKTFHNHYNNGNKNGYSTKPYNSRRNRYYPTSSIPNNNTGISNSSRSYYMSKSNHNNNNNNNNGNNNYHSSGNDKSFSAIFTSIARQRIYSDFRIARVKIGNFDVVEDFTLEPPITGLKDSRLRLYFRGSANDSVKYSNNNNNNISTPDHNSFDRAIAEPDRLSISLFYGTKRIVIPVQDGLEKVQFRRKDGYFRIKSRGWALFEEIDSRKNYNNPNSNRVVFKRCDDISNGQLEASDGLIEVWTDLRHPLPIEPKWTKGNLADYIDSRSKYLTYKVLQVLDPEHVIDFDSLVNLWVRDSSINKKAERAEFAKRHLSKLPTLLELCSKILAPPCYYVSKALAATSNNPSNPNNSSSYDRANGSSTTQLNPYTAASILDSGQITALISVSVNTLLATTVFLSRYEETKEKADTLTQLIKKVMFQVPEPILWRALDGLFGKANTSNSNLNFDYSTILKNSDEKTAQKQKEIDAAEKVAKELERLDILQQPERSIKEVQAMQDTSNKRGDSNVRGNNNNRRNPGPRNKNRSQTWANDSNTKPVSNRRSSNPHSRHSKTIVIPSTPAEETLTASEFNSNNSSMSTTNNSTEATSNASNSVNDSVSGNSTNGEGNSESSGTDESNSKATSKAIFENMDPDSALSQSNVEKVDSTLKSFKKFQKEEEKKEKEEQAKEERTKKDKRSEAVVSKKKKKETKKDKLLEVVDQEDIEEESAGFEEEEEDEDEDDEDYETVHKPKELLETAKTPKIMKDLNLVSDPNKNDIINPKPNPLTTSISNSSAKTSKETTKFQSDVKAEMKKQKNAKNVNNDQSDDSKINTDQSELSGESNGDMSDLSSASNDELSEVSADGDTRANTRASGGSDISVDSSESVSSNGSSMQLDSESSN